MMMDFGKTTGEEVEYGMSVMKTKLLKLRQDSKFLMVGSCGPKGMSIHLVILCQRII